MVDPFVKQYTKMQRGLPGKLACALFENVLDSKSWLGQIATVADEPGEWLGYILAEPNKHQLAWVYVKSIYRGHGVGLALLNAAGLKKHREIETAFAGTPRSYAARTKGWNFRWKPYLPLIAKHDEEEIALATAQFLR